MGIEYINDTLYRPRICEMLTEIENDEIDSIEKASQAAYNSISNGGLVHVFATGHSHMIVDEMFYRCGGLIPINPILESSLMLHEGAITSTLMERTPGKAEEILSKANIKKGDTIIISSNSGINTVTIEAAEYAKSIGATVVCITSKKVSEGLVSRHSNGLKLYEIGDIVIDNHAPLGDGLVEIPANHQRTGGASTFGSLFIAQLIVLKIANLYIKDDKVPPLFLSANLPGGDEYNNKMVEDYKDRIKALG